MQKQIEAILAPAKAKGLDVGCEQIGDLWQIWVGSHAGARANGVSLAHDLMRLAMPEPVAPEPAQAPRVRFRPVPVDVPISIPEFMAVPDDPEPEPIRPDPRDEEIAALKAKLAAMEAKQEVTVPSELADLIELADTPAEANAKLLAKWNEANGLIQIAHDRGERPPIELILKRDRLESGIRWNRGRLAEQV